MERETVPKSKESAGSRAALNITGVAGEYFVAAELSRRGWIATVTLKNTPMIDVMATKQDAKRTVLIQVKTRSIGNRKGWVFGKGIEQKVKRQNSYVILVDLKAVNENPDYFIIPKNVFADWIAEGHQKWLNTSGRDGQPHIDNPIRCLSQRDCKYFEKYRNRWEILDTGQ